MKGQRPYCEQFVTTEQWFGECRNPAKYGVITRGSGHLMPLCGVHVRAAMHWDADIVPVGELRAETVQTMAATQR